MLAYHRAGSASNYVLRLADAAFAAYKPNRKRLLTYPSDMTPTLPVRFCPARCSHKKIPSRNTVNIPGRDESILSPAVPPALSACLSIKKLRSSLLHVTYAHGTGLLFFRPDSSQVFPLPAPPNGALSR